MLCLIAFLMVVFSETAVSANELKGALAGQNQAAVSVLQLSKEEQKWLAQHKNIRIAYDGSLPPYSFVNDQGKVDGVAFEIISILGERLGINFIVHTDSNWNRLYRSAAKRKVDMVATMVERPDRDQWFSFTKPFLTKSLVIVTKQGNTAINNRNDLADKKIAVVNGYQYGEQVAHEFPNSKRVKVGGMLDSLYEVDKGKVDAAILFLGTANYLLAKHQMTQLKITAFYDRNSADESIAVRKDWPKLLGILQKGLDSLTEHEVQKIFAKWVVQGGVVSAVEKTAAKQAQPTVQPAAKKVVETERQPASARTQKTGLERLEPTAEPDKIVNLIGAILGFCGLWFALVRKPKKPVPHANENTKVFADDLHLKGNNATKLTLAFPSGGSDGGLSPEAQPEDQPIAINIEQLRVSQDSQFDIEADETIRYQRDTEGRFSYVSSSIKNVLGYSEADFIENYRHYLTENPLNQNLDGFVEACIQGQPNDVYEIEIYDAGQVKHWLEIRDSAIYDGQGHCIGIEGVMRDITAQRLYGEAPVKPSSESETLGGICLLQTLQEHLLSAIATSTQDQKSFALIQLSLERLRLLDGSQIDTFENKVLEEAGKRLRATLRDTDTVVVLEANKFSLVLPHTDSHSASLIVEKIRKILQVPYLVGIQTVVLDAMLGVAIYPDHGFDPEPLIDEAKKLLSTIPYENPTLNQFIDYDNRGESNLRLQQDLVLVLDECKVALRAMNPHNINALHRHSQFSVYYQSRHHLENYAISGFEALIRWQHPEFGQLMPKDFVGLVKDIGLLDVMTYWIIQQVSFQAMVWEKKRIRPKLMVINLSYLASNQPVDVAKVVDIIKETGSKPGWFAFSIPEREVAVNQDLIIPIINQLVVAGFTVAIDNFGSDSPILAQLKTLPVKIVEIDPALIRNLPENATDAAVVTKAIAVLHELGKTVIAKEVQTERQLEYLKIIGCDLIQGHLLSKPLPAKAAKELIESLPDFAWDLKQ